MPALIKNCGLKTVETIERAAETGANFIGFVHYPPSPRHLTIEEGKALKAHVPVGVRLVAVMVNPSDDILDHVAEHWTPDLLQIHAVADPARLKMIKERYKLPLILGWPVNSGSDIRATDSYHHIVDYILLDTPKEGEHGGTGQSFDWSILTREHPIIPWFLAGGLDVSTVHNAIALTHAPAVDVSSGLEDKPGVKSLEKIAAFNRAVLHGADD